MILQVPHYIGAQYLGSLTASVTVFLTYWDSLVWYEHDRGEYRYNKNAQKSNLLKELSLLVQNLIICKVTQRVS